MYVKITYPDGSSRFERTDKVNWAILRATNCATFEVISRYVAVMIARSGRIDLSKLIESDNRV